MASKKVIIKNRAGIHARPAAMIAQTAGQFEATIYLEKDNDQIDAKSIIGIITLGAPYKTELNLVAKGPDEEEAVETIAALFESKFEES